MIAAMFGAALRVGETLALRPSDLDLERGMVRVRHGKGDRARTVAIDPSAQAYVERWIAKRQALGLNGSQPLFCTITRNGRFGAALDSSYVRRLLPRLAAGPASNIEFTRTRFATRLLRRSPTRGRRCRRSAPSSGTRRQQ